MAGRPQPQVPARGMLNGVDNTIINIKKFWKIKKLKLNLHMEQLNASYIKSILSELFFNKVNIDRPLRMYTNTLGRRMFITHVKNNLLIKRLKRKYARTQ